METKVVMDPSSKYLASGKGMENLYRKTAMAAGFTFILYLVLFVFVDRAVDLWVQASWAHTWIFLAGTYISYLAQGSYVKLGLALGFIFIIAVDPGLQKKWARGLLYVCVTGACAIIIGDGLKYLLGRYRPLELFEHNLYGLHFFASKWALNSTPSGHTVRAFSLLTALSLLHPRFKVAFLSLAALIGVSRVMVTDHYPSDVLCGAFIGIFTALWAYKYFFIKDNAGEKGII